MFRKTPVYDAGVFRSNVNHQIFIDIDDKKMYYDYTEYLVKIRQADV